MTRADCLMLEMVSTFNFFYTIIMRNDVYIKIHPYTNNFCDDGYRGDNFIKLRKLFIKFHSKVSKIFKVFIGFFFFSSLNNKRILLKKLLI